MRAALYSWSTYSYFTATTQGQKGMKFKPFSFFTSRFICWDLSKKGRNEINKIEFNIYQGKVVASLWSLQRVHIKIYFVTWRWKPLVKISCDSESNVKKGFVLSNRLSSIASISITIIATTNKWSSFNNLTYNFRVYSIS